MRLRPYSSEDETTVRAIHAAQKLEFEFPDLETPTMLVKLVAVDEHGQLRAALFGRVTVEITAIIDSALPGKKKTESWQLGLKEAENQLQALGLDELQAMVGPNMNGLGKVLTRKYGFVRDDSTCYHRQF